MSGMLPDCRVLVVQNGARHNYAVPQALVKHDMLTGFYTDACGNQGWGKAVSLFSFVPALKKRLNLLKNRKVPDSVLPFTQTFPITSAAEDVITSVTGSFSEARLLGLSMAWAGVGDANMIYSSFGWSPGFLAHARRLGLKIVTEFYVRPSLWKVHKEECRLYPDWEVTPPYLSIEDPTERLRRVTCEISDEVVVPTLAVKEDVIAEGLFPAEHIHVVPYGIGDSFYSIKNQPEVGNVLFVGSCTLMKGIHYLAKVSQQIAQEQHPENITFTAAGDVSEQIRHQLVCSEICFLGRIPRTEINKLYEKADILVFPTLSDSFGAVILEAMAAGIPVICSPYCADLVGHGVSGFVVEPRDTEAWAQAVKTLTFDRELRARMAKAAKDRARQYSREGHAESLATTLKKIHASGQPA
jgi:glycosyltransferase involved in cell wall biosynthesis